MIPLKFGSIFWHFIWELVITLPGSLQSLVRCYPSDPYIGCQYPCPPMPMGFRWACVRYYCSWVGIGRCWWVRFGVWVQIWRKCWALVSMHTCQLRHEEFLISTIGCTQDDDIVKKCALYESDLDLKLGKKWLI